MLKKLETETAQIFRVIETDTLGEQAARPSNYFLGPRILSCCVFFCALNYYFNQFTNRQKVYYNTSSNK